MLPFKVQRRWKITYQYGVDGYRHELNLSKAATFFLIAFLIAVFVMAALFLFSWHRWQLSREAFTRLQQENRLLKDKLDYYSGVIDTIYQKLDTLDILDSRVRTFDRHNPIYGQADETRFADDTFIYDSHLDARVNSLELKLIEVTAALELSGALSGMDSGLEYPATSGSDGAPAIYPTFGRWSDGWGIRRHPYLKRLHFHYGVDIANKAGTPIYAAADGVITLTGYDPEYGKLIKIEHSGGYQTRYGHLHTFKAAVGDKVGKGQIIALMGNTGMSTGPHLHYEVIKDGAKVNPLLYLNRIDSDAYYARQ